MRNDFPLFERLRVDKISEKSNVSTTDGQIYLETYQENLFDVLDGILRIHADRNAVLQGFIPIFDAKSHDQGEKSAFFF